MHVQYLEICLTIVKKLAIISSDVISITLLLFLNSHPVILNHIILHISIKLCIIICNHLVYYLSPHHHTSSTNIYTKKTSMDTGTLCI